ncbi:MAG TPA: RNA polymerase sigma factor [Verrucomicrobiae bacterium]|nr:RNA polymerase sigma factor [Verrucomicrobiae bacterium]
MSAERDEVRFEIPERLQDQPDLLATLQKEHHSFLRTVLISRGATQDEADDLLEDLWGDCVGQSEDRPSLLEKYSGKCPIRSWLATVVTNRLVDLKRRQKHRGELPRLESEDADANPFERLPAAVSVESEGALVDLLKNSLQAAFANCPADAMLMLRLVYLNGVSQREVCRMWGWPEYKVSRFMSHAMEEIETATLRELKKRDRWLDLSWQDFVELCESHDIGFL